MKKKQEKELVNRNLKIPPLGVIDNIIISKGEVWAYYVLSERPYDFLSSTSKVELANATMKALGGLCQSADKKVDCHLLISNQAFSPDAWYNQMVENHKNFIGASNLPFDDFIYKQVIGLYERGYRKRVTYLGVKLFNRGSFDFSAINPLEFGFKDAFEAFKKTTSDVFKFNSTEITPLEESRSREAEKDIYRILAGSSLQAKRPSSEELLLTIKRRLYPAMPTPYLETNHEERIGLSDIVIETGGEVEVKSRWLKITQAIDNEIFTGYRASLSFSSFPKNRMYIPSPIPPFLYRSIVLPFTINCRFTLVPTESMKKELDKKKLETEDEINNLVESGQRNNANLKETLSSINSLEESLQNERLPWLSGSYRVVIEADSEENLKNWIAEIKQNYAKDEYVLTWTTGDQLDLFREEFPGGKLEMSAFNQTTNLALLGIAGINCGNSVGNPVNQTVRFRR